MTRLLILPAIFVAATLLLWLMISSAPDWQPPPGQRRPANETTFQTANGDDRTTMGQVAITSRSHLELPTQFDNFTVVAEHFRVYKEDHYIYITSLFIFVYLYKQTFAIPGSFLLNIIAGAVFGMWTGFGMCCVLTTCGSSLCYLFSELFSREYVLYYFGERLTYLQQKVDDNSHRLLPFLLFARLFPISPSWLLNIVAPFLNIPLSIFAFSALIGLAPYNFICVQAGYILADLKSWEDVLSTSTMLKLCSFALLPLLYALFSRRQPRSQDSLSSGGVSAANWRRRVLCCGTDRRKRRRVISVVPRESKPPNFIAYDRFEDEDENEKRPPAIEAYGNDEAEIDDYGSDEKNTEKKRPIEFIV